MKLAVKNARLWQKTKGIYILCILNLLLALLNLMMSGCGNFNSLGHQFKAPIDTVEDPLTYPDLIGIGQDGEEVLDGNYICSRTPNVHPDHDWEETGAGHYTVCRHRTSLEDILIHGQTLVSNMICVFPVKRWIDTQGMVHKDVAFDGPNDLVKLCQDVTPGGLKLKFAGLKARNFDFNMVYVTEAPWAFALEECLKAQDDSLCPSNVSTHAYFSVGEFR